MEQEEKLCDRVETVKEFTYLGDRANAGGGCEAAVSAKTKYWWAKLRECSELLHGSKFPLKLKWAVRKSYVRSEILYGSEAWCLEENDMGILQRIERSRMSAIYGIQLKDRKKSMDLMFMLGVNETIDQLAMANSDRWYDHVLRREDGHVLKRALDLRLKAKGRKGCQRGHGKSRLTKKE